MVSMRQQLVSQETWSSGGTAGLELDVPMATPPADRSRRLPLQGLATSTMPFQALATTIRNEVLPRLLLAHRAMTVPAAPLPQSAWSDPVIELSGLVVGQDAVSAMNMVDGMVASGTSIETIYLDLLAPVARRLGVLWQEDVCDIADVTIGLWRLREVMRGLGGAFLDEGSFQNHGRSVLLVPAPGETHSFGLAMVSDFFMQAGWNVSGGVETAGKNLSEWVRATHFTVVGFSTGCDASLQALAEGIRMVRRRSRNRSVGVMVGGPLFSLDPDLAARVGADATAVDGRQAVNQANALVTMLGSRR